LPGWLLPSGTFARLDHGTYCLRNACLLQLQASLTGFFLSFLFSFLLLFYYAIGSFRFVFVVFRSTPLSLPPAISFFLLGPVHCLLSSPSLYENPTTFYLVLGPSVSVGD
jgi:hypothetical protein